MTTADEFLQFAQELGLGQVNNATEIDTKPTGLTVLKNLCLLIEQIHELKNENDRLRSQLALANELDSISSRRKRLNSSNSMLDEERILVSSPKECPRSKRSPSKRNLKSKNHSFHSEPKTVFLTDSNDTASHLDEASSILQLDQETVDQNSGFFVEFFLSTKTFFLQEILYRIGKIGFEFDMHLSLLCVERVRRRRAQICRKTIDSFRRSTFRSKVKKKIFADRNNEENSTNRL